MASYLVDPKSLESVIAKFRELHSSNTHDRTTNIIGAILYIHDDNLKESLRHASLSNSIEL